MVENLQSYQDEELATSDTRATNR